MCVCVDIQLVPSRSCRLGRSRPSVNCWGRQSVTDGRTDVTHAPPDVPHFFLRHHRHQKGKFRALRLVLHLKPTQLNQQQNIYNNNKKTFERYNH